MDVNYHTQVQPNNTAMPLDTSHTMSVEGAGSKINMPDKVDKVNQGLFDRSMEKNSSENNQTQQLAQQIMEKLAPILTQLFQDLIGESQNSQAGSGAGGTSGAQAPASANGASEAQTPASVDGTGDSQQASSPQEQLVQQILERLLAYIEQMIQEMTEGHLQGDPAGASEQAAMPSNPMENSSPQQAGSPQDVNEQSTMDAQSQSQKDQVLQEVMQMLVPLVEQIVGSIFAQANQQAGGYAPVTQ